MGKNHKHFDYFKSKILDLEYCIHKTNQEKVHFSDGVVYNWSEIKEIHGMPPEKVKKIHSLKKEHPDYKMSELITLLNSSEIEHKGLSILRDIFDGEIIGEG